MPVLGGGGTPVHILWEDGAGGYNSSPSDTTAKVPGADPRIQTLEARHNGRRLYLPGSGVAYDIEEGAFDGTFAIAGGLTNPWMFRSIYGAPTTVDNSDGSYTHTYSGFDPDPFRLIVGYDLSTKAERVIQGCVTARISIDPTMEQMEYAPFLWEGFYAEESANTSVSLTSTPTPSNDALDVGDLTLKRGGTTEATARTASLALELPNARPFTSFGSRFPTDFLAGNFEPSLQYGQVKEDTDTQQDFYGGTTSMSEDMTNQAKAELNFDNGVNPGSGINKILFEGSGDSMADAFSEENIGDPTTWIVENLERLIEDIDVKATNETATAP